MNMGPAFQLCLFELLDGKPNHNTSTQSWFFDEILMILR
jgi:hypothetical protein